MRLSPEVEIALNLAANEAGRRQHEFVLVEHLLYALLFDDDSKKIIRHAGGDIAKVRSRVERFLDDEVPQKRELVQPSASLGFRRVVQRALSHAQSADTDEVTCGNLLIAMFAEQDSVALEALSGGNLTRLNVLKFVTHNVSMVGDPDDDKKSSKRASKREHAGDDGEESEDDAKDPLEAFTLNLNEEVKLGRIDPIIGRAKEIDRCVQILARRKKNNPLLIGDAGVGKTAIAEGLAYKIVHGQVPKALLEATVYSLDMGALLAGTRFRGDFEQRMKNVIKALEAQKDSILFIDEIHTILGAGQVSGGTMDASNMLKPSLASGKIRCMGSTTFSEFRQHFEKDRALTRRFQKVDVAEPSREECVEILRGLKKQYEDYHHVAYDDAALEAAVDLSIRYLQDRKLPDKAIDLIDEAGAKKKLAHSDEENIAVSVEDIEAVVATMAQIPPRQVSTDDKSALKNLESDLANAVFGQEEPVKTVSNAIKLARAGLRTTDKPIGSFLFTGPTGVGKTELAKQLAKTLGIAFVRFDMSEYMEAHTVSRLIGAPPGYVGFDRGGLLTDAVTKTPHAVVLLDEIEKAHPDIFNVLLQVMDHGTLTDNNGKSADFRHIILIMTSNVGVRDMARRPLGFGETTINPDVDKEYKRLFSPEFRNRLDARVQFKPLDRRIMGSIVRKFLRETEALLAEKQITLTATDAAIEWLGREGYDESFGARPLARVVQQHVRQPASEEILFGELSHGGGTIELDVADNKLALRCVRAKKQAEPEQEPKREPARREKSKKLN